MAGALWPDEDAELPLEPIYAKKSFAELIAKPAIGSGADIWGRTRKSGLMSRSSIAARVTKIIRKASIEGPEGRAAAAARAAAATVTAGDAVGDAGGDIGGDADHADESAGSALLGAATATAAFEFARRKQVARAKTESLDVSFSDLAATLPR